MIGALTLPRTCPYCGKQMDRFDYALMGGHRDCLQKREEGEMKGINELKLCQAELVAGLEYYLINKVGMSGIKVSSVNIQKDCLYSDSATVRIEGTEKVE